MKEKYHVIGLMSGTSLDGVDIAFCEFIFSQKWKFSIVHAQTFPYDENWKKIISEVHNSSAEEISRTDFLYGKYLGGLVRSFCQENKFSPDFISSHGHTVFHQPKKGFTKQIGSGAAIAASSGLNVVCDFRSSDIANGGQGAPLVPVGDKYLFPEVDFCLNLGGIANISIQKNNRVIAFDICGCNQVLNYYAGKEGSAFDKDGSIAASGSINISLLKDLNNTDYSKKQYPKSLGREDIESVDFRILEKYNLENKDMLSTYCEHIAIQISKCIENEKTNGKLLVSGGGVFNSHLLNRIKNHAQAELVIPSKEIIEFKEALIFAFLGVLRMEEKHNIFQSVTGSSKDTCGGCIYLY